MGAGWRYESWNVTRSLFPTSSLVLASWSTTYNNKGGSHSYWAWRFRHMSCHPPSSKLNRGIPYRLDKIPKPTEFENSALYFIYYRERNPTGLLNLFLLYYTKLPQSRSYYTVGPREATTWSVSEHPISSNIGGRKERKDPVVVPRDW